MLKNQGQELVSGVLRYDMYPFSKLKILVKGDDFGRQEINLNLTPNQKPYLKIVTKGIIFSHQNIAICKVKRLSLYNQLFVYFPR